MQQQAQINEQSQMMAAQVNMKKVEMETQAKLQIEQAEAQFQIDKLKAEAELKKDLMDHEFQYQMKLQGMQVDGLKTREEDREKAKSDRISQQNTEQSKLIQQRQEKLPSISFESNEDSLDGFDLAEFEPR